MILRERIVIVFIILIVVILPLSLNNYEWNEVKSNKKVGAVQNYSFQPIKQLSQISKKSFSRKIPKKKIDIKDIKEILNSSLEKNRSKELVDLINNIKLRPDVTAKNLKLGEVWNLYRLPRNNREYKKYINEIKITMKALIVEYAVADRVEDLIKANSAYVYADILSKFDFTGKTDKQGHFLFKFPLGGSKRVPSSENTFGFALDENPLALTSLEEMVNLRGKQNQTTYFDPNIAKGILSDVVHGSLFEKKVVGLFSDYINTRPEDFHGDNLEVIDDTLKSAQEYAKENGRPYPYDITALEFKDLAIAVVRKKAFRYALISSGASSVISLLADVFGFELVDQTKKLIGGYRMMGWGIIGAFTLGIETYFTAMGIYLGAQRVYVLHRFYSFMQGAKSAKNITGQAFDPEVVKRSFKAKRIIFGEAFKNHLTQSLFSGLAYGLGIKVWAGRYMWKKGAFPFLGWMFRIPRQKLANIIIKQYILSFFFFKTVINGIVGAIPDVLGKYLKGSSSKFIKFMMNKFPSMDWSIFLRKNFYVEAALTIFDFTITGISIYSAVFSRLYYFVKIMDNTYDSTGEAIQYTLLHKTFASTPDEENLVLEGTREVFYPLCAILAVNGEFISKPESNLFRIRRQKACLEMIAVAERLSSTEEIKDIYPTLYDILTAEDEIPKLKNDLYAKIMDKVEYEKDYPSYLKIFWLAGLRSIFSRIKAPPLYDRVKHDMIFGIEHSLLDIADIIRSNPDTASTLLNLDRLNYKVHDLAVTSYKFSEKNTRDDSILQPDVKDDDKIPVYLELHKAFITYWKFNHNEAIKLRDKLAGALINYTEKVAKNENIYVGTYGLSDEVTAQKDHLDKKINEPHFKESWGDRLNDYVSEIINTFKICTKELLERLRWMRKVLDNNYGMDGTSDYTNEEILRAQPNGT